MTRADWLLIARDGDEAWPLCSGRAVEGRSSRSKETRRFGQLTRQQRPIRAYCTSMEYREIAVESLLLDPLNPRNEPVEGQHAAIAALLDDKGTPQLLRLAEDIAKHGPSPIELALVVPDGNLFIVVEGNRRLAAMKLLKNPGLAGRSKIKQQIYELSKRSVAVDSMACIVADSREEARRWIEIRHNGSQQGVGIVGWSPEMQVRFTGLYSGQRGRALRLTDALEAAYEHDSELLQLIQAVKTVKITTLGRLVSDPDFRTSAGIEIKGDEVQTHFLPSEMRAFWHRLLSHLADDLTVSALKSKKQRTDYLEKLESVTPPAESRRPLAPLAAEPAREQAAKPPTGAAPSPPNRGPKKQRARPMRLFYGLQLRNVKLKVKDVLREAQCINLSEFPNASAVLIRVVVELVVAEAVEYYQCQVSEGLRERIHACLSELDPSGKADRYLPIRQALSDRNSPFAVRSLQAYLHNPLLHPDGASLRAISDNYTVLLRDLDDALGNTQP